MKCDGQKGSSSLSCGAVHFHPLFMVVSFSQVHTHSVQCVGPGIMHLWKTSVIVKADSEETHRTLGPLKTAAHHLRVSLGILV